MWNSFPKSEYGPYHHARKKTQSRQFGERSRLFFRSRGRRRRSGYCRESTAWNRYKSCTSSRYRTTPHAVRRSWWSPATLSWAYDDAKRCRRSGRSYRSSPYSIGKNVSRSRSRWRYRRDGRRTAGSFRSPCHIGGIRCADRLKSRSSFHYSSPRPCWSSVRRNGRRCYSSDWCRNPTSPRHCVYDGNAYCGRRSRRLARSLRDYGRPGYLHWRVWP